MKLKSHKLIVNIFMLLFISLFFELFIFNYRHWSTVNNHLITNYNLTLGDGFSDNGDGTYIVTEGEQAFCFNNLDRVLDSAYININVISRGKEDIRPVTVGFRVTDVGHKSYYGLPGRELWEKENRSKYIPFHLYGKCNDLKITSELSIGEIFTFKIQLNPVIPLFISWERLIYLFFVFLLCYCFRPNSRVYRINYLEINKGLRITIILFFLAVQILIFQKLTVVNPHFVNQIGESLNEYQNLAMSFKAGSVSILEEPCETLLAMENPYDTSERFAQLEKNGGSILWDHAFYNGKYYVYFGVVPVILFYFPHYLIWGEHLTNHVVILMCIIVILIGMLLVLDEIIKRWYRKCSIGTWFLLIELLVTGSEIIYMSKRPDTYSVPIALSLAFGLLGLWCFFKATNQEELSLKYLFCGSLLTALIAGCRPQLFLFILLDIILVRKYCFSLTYFKTKKGKLAWLSALVPIICVASALMYYNFIRFDSPFDFGSNYNLTMNDMRYRGWIWDRMPLAILAYFFQPIAVNLVFPFIKGFYFETNYMGVTIQETTFGGIFAVMPFVLISLVAIVKKKKLSKYKTPMLMIYTALLSALIIAVVDAQMAGILKRYFGDFSIFMLIAGVLTTCIVMNKWRNSRSINKSFNGILLACLLFKIIFESLNFFSDVGQAISDMRPELFAHYKYLWMFWI